uniref:Uncharacterized protein n=1 Tax=Arion vulgaris TaxID=1028688 RepID=A0A0B7BI97_9EUPU
MMRDTHDKEIKLLLKESVRAAILGTMIVPKFIASEQGNKWEEQNDSETLSTNAELKTIWANMT